jgi:hypothetical protein
MNELEKMGGGRGQGKLWSTSAQGEKTMRKA